MKWIGAHDPAVTAAEFRNARHLPEDTDASFEEVLEAAEAVVTTATGVPLTLRTVEFVVPVGGWRRWWFPLRPVVALTSIEAMGDAGTWDAQDITDVRVWQDHDEPQIVLPEDWAGWDADPDLLRITASVGFDGDGPVSLKRAIILLAAEFYDAGIAPDEVITHQISFPVKQLIRQNRYMRPCMLGAE